MMIISFDNSKNMCDKLKKGIVLASSNYFDGIKARRHRWRFQKDLCGKSCCSDGAWSYFVNIHGILINNSYIA